MCRVVLYCDVGAVEPKMDMTKNVRPFVSWLYIEGARSCVMMVGCLDLNILTFSISLVGSTIDSIWPAPLEIICFFSFFPLTLLYLLNTPVNAIPSRSYLVLTVILRASGRLVFTHYALLRIHSDHCAGDTHYVSSFPVSLLKFQTACADSLVVLFVALYSGRWLFPSPGCVFSFANLFSLCGLDRDDHPFRPVQPKSKCWHRQ